MGTNTASESSIRWKFCYLELVPWNFCSPGTKVSGEWEQKFSVVLFLGVTFVLGSKKVSREQESQGGKKSSMIRSFCSCKQKFLAALAQFQAKWQYIASTTLIHVHTACQCQRYKLVLKCIDWQTVKYGRLLSKTRRWLTEGKGRARFMEHFGSVSALCALCIWYIVNITLHSPAVSLSQGVFHSELETATFTPNTFILSFSSCHLRTGVVE